MILLGMTGPIGHGKTSFADALAAVEPATQQFETFTVIAEVVDLLHKTLGREIPAPTDIMAINDWLSQLPTILSTDLDLRITFNQIKLYKDSVAAKPIEYEKLFQHLTLLAKHPELANQPITAENKSIYRPILQWIGGYLVAKVGAGIWWDEINRRTRLAAEQGAKVCVASSIRYPNDAKAVRAAGGKIVSIIRPDTAQADTLDPTERERDSVRPHTTIVNNGSLADLRAVAQAFLSDAQTNTLKSTYTAKSISSI